MYDRIIKSLFDKLVSIIILLLLLPVMLVIAISLWLFQGGSPFFTQQRPGKNRRIFTLIKFRTMNNKRDARGQLLPDAKRITKVGQFVRSTSLDELPQLFNVLSGDMSLVGPRPLLVKYLDRYSPRQARRHEVKPGITGWAQVNGRNALRWEDKLELDVWYVEHQSFWLDMKILWKTLGKVVRRSGISSGSAATMEEFKGSN